MSYLVDLIIHMYTFNNTYFIAVVVIWYMCSWIYCTISAYMYHRSSCEFESHSWGGILDTTLCDSLSATCDGLVVFLSTPLSSTNKTDCHNITEKLLKVALTLLNYKSQSLRFDIYILNVIIWGRKQMILCMLFVSFYSIFVFSKMIKMIKYRVNCFTSM